MIQLTFEQGLSRAIPLHYATALRLEGESEWSVGGERWATGPGTLGVKVPGEVYVERARSGRSRLQILAFADTLVEGARAALDQPPSHPRASSFDGARDPRVRPLMALHRAFLGDASTDAELEETLSEALVTLVTLTSLPPRREERSAGNKVAVTRARALLDARITEAVSLDELAAHARLASSASAAPFANRSAFRRTRTSRTAGSASRRIFSREAFPRQRSRRGWGSTNKASSTGTSSAFRASRRAASRARCAECSR